jgi:hypothetical protein
MIGSKKRYDEKHKLTRILLADYLVLKRMSQAAGVSMAEALHGLIEQEAEFRVTGIPVPAIRLMPVSAVALNGSKTAAFRIKTGGFKYV